MAPVASERPWRPSGVVTLTTDFGTDDVYAGVMKGVMLAAAPELAIVDLTHAIAPQDVRAASFHLERAWRWFSAGTVHVAVVDPGVGSERAVLVAREGDHAFLAPDNGLLDGVLSEQAEVRALDVERFSLSPRSRTFHGRDVFAPAAARIAAGLSPAEAGAPAPRPARRAAPAAERGPAGELAGEVVHADRFGNLITSVCAAELEGPAEEWRARIGGLEVPLLGTYAQAGPGELLALVDSFGRLELAERGGSAARRLGLGPGAAVVFVRRRSS